MKVFDLFSGIGHRRSRLRKRSITWCRPEHSNRRIREQFNKEKLKMIIGIDPGQSGAIAAIENGHVVALFDMPISDRLYGKGQQVDARTLATDFSNIMQLRDDPLSRTPVYLEAVSARPPRRKNGQEGHAGTLSSFRFGESLGIVLGVLGALHLPVHWITPQVWKRRAGLRGKEKDAARTLAMQLHPEIANQLARKMDVGRADAILIAEFGEKSK